MKRLVTVFVAAGAVAVVAGSGMAALAAGTASPSVVHGCVSRSHVLSIRAGNRRSCPKGDTALNWNQSGPQGPQGAAGPAGRNAGPVSVTASTSLTDHPDSGNAGNWADDDMVRVATITRHGAVPSSDCGSSAVQCWFYTATIVDTGTFTTISGAQSPNQNATDSGVINGTVTGSISGVGLMEFYADSPVPDAQLVPTSASGNNPTDTTDWYKLFFTALTQFGATSSANAPWTSWSWTYSASSTCEQWTDSLFNGDGNQAGDGNIAGVNECA